MMPPKAEAAAVSPPCAKAEAVAIVMATSGSKTQAVTAMAVSGVMHEGSQKRSYVMALSTVVVTVRPAVMAYIAPCVVPHRLPVDHGCRVPSLVGHVNFTASARAISMLRLRLGASEQGCGKGDHRRNSDCKLP